MEPKGAECYSGVRASYKLYFPFSLYFIQQLESNKAFFVSDTQKLKQRDGEISEEALVNQRDRMRNLVVQTVVAYDELFKGYPHS